METENAYLRIMAERHPSALDDHAVARLRELSRQGDTVAERVLARYDKWRYDHASTLPLSNPLQVGDVLAAYWMHRNGRWPHAGTGGVARHNLRPARVTTGFLEHVQRGDMTTALRWLEMSRPSLSATLGELSARSSEDGEFSYDHPRRASLGAALTELSSELWSAVLTRKAGEIA